MIVKFAICSEGTSVDKGTNKLSIFSVQDKIDSFVFPLWIPKICMSLVIEREGDEPKVSKGKLLALMDGNQIGANDIFLRYQNDDVARTVLIFSLGIPAPGEVIFRISVPDHREIEVMKLPVQQVAQRPGETAIAVSAVQENKS